MKTLIIIFGLLYTGCCKPSDPSPDYYIDEDNIQNDDGYEIYQDRTEPEESVSEENKVRKGDDDIKISTVGRTFTKTVTETVVLPCKITGDDYVRVWRRHGAVLYQGKIGMGAKNNMQLTEEGNLKISNLQENDKGEYECMAMISESKKPTITHTVILHTPPHIESLTAKDNIKVLTSGQSLTLNCTASGNPPPVISWHKGSERLAITGNVLRIDQVKHHDAGEYKCLADNKIGEPSFEAIHIRVEHKPIVTIDRISVSSENEQDTELKCIVHAEPKAQVGWMKNGENIKNEPPHITLTNNKNIHALVIKNLNASDFGVYTCSAVNSIGTTNKNISLVRTPAIIKFIKPKNDSRDVVLTWKVQSKSPISEHELQYRKKGESDWQLIKPEISTAENEVYTVRYVLSGLEPGIYETRIRSQNQHGWSEYSEIMPFEGVYAKHGHHKNHKKVHKDHKEIKGAQEVEKPTQTVKSLDVEEPAEHPENVTFKDASVGASEINAASGSRSTLAWMSVALIIISQFRTPTIRL